MAVTISYTFADEFAPRIVAAFCATFRYEATVGGEPNPETPAEFARRMVAEYVKGVVVGHEAAAAQAAALESLRGEVGAASVTIGAEQG